jgi:L-alanine-DL-glutamate epimerase-like enolase superfamily enzyme
VPSRDGDSAVMKITAIREATVPDRTRTRNASIRFSSMTASALVVETDRIRDGTPLRGLAFDSVGRYAHGALLRERFMPRLLAAKPGDYLNETGENIDPAKVWTILMRDEKPEGHGERAGAVGLVDAAIWDLVAKVAGRAPHAGHLLAACRGRSRARPSRDGAVQPVRAWPSDRRRACPRRRAPRRGT